MKEDEKKRLSAVLHATEYLFLENMALKLVLEHRGIANWQKLVDHLISDKDVLVDQPQQMVFGNWIVQTEVVEQRLTPGVVSHHDQQASNHRNPAKHESFYHAFADSQLLISVTFSTPTRVSAQNPLSGSPVPFRQKPPVTGGRFIRTHA